ncbi:hypothetical protein [Pseudomonas sp. Fl4BN1]|uniref:hypothetical protein n=1 Tax=Pseudomonas sp. Fl4BN1 TaxID=2697651 RepID=UPI0013788346|nr:hypothetical protein [Pseudomonas sp. Fl4BN1]NBF11714.1 hypothetical protein [Pseudomonas sp. Fl4BN1]
MARLAQFSPPAHIQDFSDNRAQQERMNAAWSDNINRWANAAMVGDIWSRTNNGPRPAFYNPLLTDTPDTSANAAITWNAFPGRLQALFPTQAQSWQQWADQGVPLPVTTNLCSGSSVPPAPYSPTGPRGWQDEYCEWSVTRNSAGKITSVMFTCENPEYWMTLWQVDPGKVLQIYQQTIHPAVQLSDLCLRDALGQVLLDPLTGAPCYNPLNKWNCGTRSLPDSGGAMHLTSSPNTLGAEYDLAASATLPREDNHEPVTSASRLVCFARYGRIGRHSDPTIGQNVNQFVNYTPSLPLPQATLTDPPGLYMQTPNFSGYQSPDNTPAENFWTVVRGDLKDPKVPGDIDRILHATFSVPPEKNYTVGDIKINDQPIDFGSQIAATITMALMATVFPNSGVTQTAVGRSLDKELPNPAVSALQPLSVFNAYRAQEQACNEDTMSIPVLALALQPGQQVSNIALLLDGTVPDGAVFTVPEGGVSIRIDGTQQQPTGVYLVTLSVEADAAIGDRTILASVPSLPATQQAAIGLLTVGGPTLATRQSAPVKAPIRRGRD